MLIIVLRFKPKVHGYNAELGIPCCQNRFHDQISSYLAQTVRPIPGSFYGFISLSPDICSIVSRVMFDTKRRTREIEDYLRPILTERLEKDTGKDNHDEPVS